MSHYYPYYGVDDEQLSEEYNSDNCYDDEVEETEETEEDTEEEAEEDTEEDTGESADYSDESDDDDESDDESDSLIIGEEYRRFGYFQCRQCDKTWQSAFVFCEYKGKKNGEHIFKVRFTLFMLLEIYH